ncbi:MAG: T9SS type A sorting domain-containing protein [Ignavibacteriaceae bacterium]|nr:T9SS type A sorting domain-containing protein [Ignavibacteriaceae bacterium]
MTRKLSMFFFLVLFSQVFLVAQQKMILRPDNTLEKVTRTFDGHETIMVPPSKHAVQNHTIKSRTLAKSVNGTIDTLFYNDGSFNTNFGFFGQDWGMQWFIAPTELIIKKVGYSSTDDTGGDAEIKIVKLLWTKAQLAATGTTLEGRYEATGNGFNNITAFPSNPDATAGGWQAIKEGATSPFDVVDVWSDAGSGAPTTPVIQTSLNYQWVPMNLITEPTIAAGQIFGVALKNVAPGFNLAADRLGLWSGASTTLNGWKYYANGRTDGDLTTAGWWTRTYTWDFVVEVELIGDVAPEFVSFEKLTTTVDQSARTVHANITDQNPSGGPAGVSSAVLHYSLDSGKTFTDVTMTGAAPDFSAAIPGQSPGQYVVYNATATDPNGNSTNSKTYAYSIFLPTPGIKTLVVFNGYTSESGYPMDYYFGIDSMTSYDTYQFPHDVWAFGPLEKALVDNYDNIFEICTTGPADYNEALIKVWLSEKATRNYFLAGQEYLGAKNAYTNVTYAAGDFEYDVLGLAGSWNDISYAASVGQKKPSRLFAKTGTMLGGELNAKFTAWATDSLNYDPTYEIGDEDNWIDGFDVQAGQEVDVEVESRGIDNVAHVANYPCVTHRTLTAGNKIVFMSLDPLSVNSRAKYYWFGFSKVSPQVKALEWFGANQSLPPTVEFRANMSVQLKKGTFAATDSVWVRGDFNSWGGKDFELKDADGDSIYSAVFTNFTEGQSLTFKYVHSPDVWESTGNRTLTVTAGPNVTSACWEDICIYVPSKTIKVTFSVNMELERLSTLFNPATSTVSARGSFNGWGETMMTASPTNLDVYEVVADVIAAVGEKVNFKYFYSPGTWEVDKLTDPTQNDRYFIVSQANFDAAAITLDVVGFNNGEVGTVLNQDANITFTCNTNGASIIDAPAGTVFTSVYMCGANSPLQWPGGGWSDAEITKAIQLFDDGTHGDVTAGDKIFTTNSITFLQWSTLTVVYKYGANWGLATNGGKNDNEGGVGADKTLKMGRYTSKATVVDTFGIVHTTDVSKVEKLGNTIPTVYMLEQNYPNPFNPETSIRFSIPQESFVTVKVFNTLGEEVMTLVNEQKTAGVYNASFKANNLTSGIYFYTIKANDFTSTKKMILMK